MSIRCILLRVYTPNLSFNHNHPPPTTACNLLFKYQELMQFVSGWCGKGDVALLDMGLDADTGQNWGLSPISGSHKHSSHARCKSHKRPDTYPWMNI